MGDPVGLEEGGTTALGVPPTMQRVKLYRLNDSGVWDDKGTGHVSVEYMEVRRREGRRDARRSCCAQCSRGDPADRARWRG